MSQKGDTWALNSDRAIKHIVIVLWKLFQIMNVPEQKILPLVPILWKIFSLNQSASAFLL